VQIDLKALAENYLKIAKLTKNNLMAVLKADAYGHGIVECAKTLVEVGANDLGVLDICEANTIRRSGIKANIHIISGLFSADSMAKAISSSFSIFVYSTEQLEQLTEVAKNLDLKAQVRLKVDTGMGRLGVAWQDAIEVVKSIKLKHIDLVGLATHLATNGDEKADIQLQRFKKLQSQIAVVMPRAKRHSALSSGGLLAYGDYSDSLSRPGLLLYGYSPFGEDCPSLSLEAKQLVEELRPVMSVKSAVIEVKKVKAGETVSYDRTFTAKKDLTMAVVPFGYAHGLSRTRSNKGCALIKGARAPLLGRVCMNLSMYNVTGHDVVAGDEVVFLGRQGQEEISACQAGAWQRTNVYEALCLFGRLSPRYYGRFDVSVDLSVKLII
jgi:alanine racemase